MTDLVNSNIILTNAVNVFCEYITASIKRNNSNISSFNGRQLGAFKNKDNKYSSYYVAITNFAKRDITSDNFIQIICEIFFHVVDDGFLNSSSLKILNYILESQTKIGEFDLNSDWRTKLKHVKTKMHEEFENFAEQVDEVNSPEEDPLPNKDPGAQTTFMVPNTINTTPIEDSQSTQLLLDQVAALNSQITNGQNLSGNPLPNFNETNNQNVLTALLSTFQTIFNNQMHLINSSIAQNSKNVDDRLKSFAKLLDSNQAVNNYYLEVEKLTKIKLKNENHLNLLQNYLKASRTPPSLNHDRFPRCMFNFSKNSDYFDDYNIIVEICQKSLLELNVRELKRMIDKNEADIKNFKALISDFDDEVNKKFADIDSRANEENESLFVSTNEHYNRIIKDPVVKFPINKPKKSKNNDNNKIKSVSADSSGSTSSNPSDKSSNNQSSMKKKTPVVKNQQHKSRNISDSSTRPTYAENRRQSYSNRRRSNSRNANFHDSNSYQGNSTSNSYNNYFRNDSRAFSNSRHQNNNNNKNSAKTSNTITKRQTCNNASSNSPNNFQKGIINSNMASVSFNQQQRSFVSNNRNSDQRVFRSRRNSSVRN